MKRLLATALAASLMAGPVWACPEEKTIYVFDSANASWDTYSSDSPGPNDPASGERIKMSIRFLSEGKLELTKNDKKTVFATGGIATGFAWRMASLPGTDDEQDTHRYRVFDLSKVVRKGAPKEVLVFDDDLFWPTCP